MTVVLVPGVPETAAVWKPIISALAEKEVTDVLALSLPGFGAPTPAGWDAHPSSYVKWLCDELEKIDGPIDLVGHDWGAVHVMGVVSSSEQSKFNLRSWAVDCVGSLHPDYEWHTMAKEFQKPQVGELIISTFTGPSVDLPTRTSTVVQAGLPIEVAQEIAPDMNEEMGRCILALYRASTAQFRADILSRTIESPCKNRLIISATEDIYGSIQCANSW